MPTLRKFLNEGKVQKKQVLKQYLVGTNSYKAIGDIKTIESLEPAIYKVSRQMDGIHFNLHEVKTDELLKFEDERYDQVLTEIDNFWKLKEDFEKMGFTHKRGILLYGKPGTGKSCLLKQVMDEAVKNKHIVLLVSSPHSLLESLNEIKEIEKERRILVILEDVDEMIKYGGDEHTLLELFDGGLSLNNICFLGTTNYINRLPPRMLRASRFDRKIEIGTPPFEGRYSYLNKKLSEKETTEKIKELAEKTKDFTFAQLKELVVSIYCLKQNEDEVINRIKNNLETLSENKIEELWKNA